MGAPPSYDSSHGRWAAGRPELPTPTLWTAIRLVRPEGRSVCDAWRKPYEHGVLR